MKTKNSLPFMRQVIAAAVCAAALLPIRVYQYLKLIESDTGFYARNNVTVYLVYALLLFLVLFSFIVCFRSRKTLSASPDAAPGVPQAAAMLCAALGIALDTAEKFTGFMEIYNNYQFNGSLTLSKYLSQEGGTILLLCAVFGLIGTAYFGILAGAALSKKDIAPKLKIPALAPALWAVMRLLMMFKTKIKFLNVSDLFLELFAMAFLMLFLFYFAVAQSRVDKGESYYKVFAYGWPAAVLLITVSVPRLILSLAGKSDALCTGYGFSVCYCAMAVFVSVTLITRAYSAKSVK